MIYLNVADKVWREYLAYSSRPPLYIKNLYRAEHLTQFVRFMKKYRPLEIFMRPRLKAIGLMIIYVWKMCRFEHNVRKQEVTFQKTLS